MYLFSREKTKHVHKGQPALSNIYSIAQNLLQKDYHGEGREAVAQLAKQQVGS